MFPDPSSLVPYYYDTGGNLYTLGVDPAGVPCYFLMPPPMLQLQYVPASPANSTDKGSPSSSGSNSSSQCRRKKRVSSGHKKKSKGGGSRRSRWGKPLHRKGKEIWRRKEKESAASKQQVLEVQEHKQELKDPLPHLSQHNVWRRRPKVKAFDLSDTLADITRGDTLTMSLASASNLASIEAIAWFKVRLGREQGFPFSERNVEILLFIRDYFDKQASDITKPKHLGSVREKGLDYRYEYNGLLKKMLMLDTEHEKGSLRIVIASSAYSVDYFDNASLRVQYELGKRLPDLSVLLAVRAFESLRQIVLTLKSKGEEYFKNMKQDGVSQLLDDCERALRVLRDFFERQTISKKTYERVYTDIFDDSVALLDKFLVRDDVAQLPKLGQLITAFRLAVKHATIPSAAAQSEAQLQYIERQEKEAAAELARFDAGDDLFDELRQTTGVGLNYRLLTIS